MSSITEQRNQYMVDGVAHERRDWTDDEAKSVKDKWFAGWSAGQIANQMEGRSRNAIISLVNRRKWDRNNNNTNQHDRKLEPAAPYKRADGAGARPPRPPKPVRLKAPTLHLPVKRTTHNATHLLAIRDKTDPGGTSKHEQPSDGVGLVLEQLTNETCRWPKGTPGDALFVFCGHVSADCRAGRPYCAEHTRRAHL